MAGVPSGWNVDLTGSATADRDTTVVYSGVASLKYSNPDNASNGGWHGLVINDDVLGQFCLPLRPGAMYRVRVASRTNRIAGGQKYRLFFYHNVAQTVSQNKEFVYAAINTWQLDEWSFTVPLNAEANSSFFVQFNRNGDATATDFWIDSLRIIEQEVGAQGGSELANSGREDLILGGDFEGGLAWWGDLGTNIASIETGANIYLGAKSLKITHTAAANERVFLVDDLGDTTLGKPMTVRVQPTDRIRIRMAGKVSGASMTIGFGIKLLKHDKTVDTDSNPGQLQFTTTSFVEKEFVLNLVGISNIYYIQVYVYMIGASSGTGYADEIHIWRMKQNSDIVDRTIQGVKLAGEAVNAQEIGMDIPVLAAMAGRDLVLNGDAEWTTWFAGAPFAVPAGFWMDSAGGTIGSSATAYQGSNSLSVSDSAGAALDWFQTWHTVGGGGSGTHKLLVRVEPLSTIVFSAAGKLSAATTHTLKLGVEKFDGAKASLGKDTVLQWTTETSFTLKWAIYTVPANTYYICIWIGTSITGGTPAAQLIDEIHGFYTPQRLTAGRMIAPVGTDLWAVS